MSNSSCFLSTIDNPFNPFEMFSDWFQFDCEHGYNSCGRVARMIDIRNDMTDSEIARLQEEAIDLLVKNDPIGLYIKVVKE